MYVLFDIGGTKTRIAVSSDLHTFTNVYKFETPLLYVHGLQALKEGIEVALNGSKVTALAGGIRGPLNHEKTGITRDSKLKDWVGRSITGDLTNIFNAPTFLENDSAIVGLGEVAFGAGKGYDIVAYHTVSTGVGGARYVHGSIDAASAGFEPGHQVLDVDRTVLGHHTAPTLQNLVSGAALEARRGKKPYEISQDDHVWAELAGYLAAGLKNTIVYWSPDVIVLGGSMIVGNPRILLQDIEDKTREAIGHLMPCPKIVDATLKDEGGLYGAMALLGKEFDHKIF